MNNEVVTTKKEQVKEFLKKNWPVLLGTVVAGTAAVIGVKQMAKTVTKHIGDANAIERAFLTENIEFPSKLIDEDIFTAVAPAIETAVLDKGVENLTLERSYDLGDNIHSLVTVKIEKVYGD